MNSFSGKVAVITGAASGIGRELALQLSAEGSIIAAVDYNKKGLDETVKLVKASGGKASAYVADVSDIKKVKKLAADVKKEFGAVDILINNAGVTLFGRFNEIGIDDFEWIMGINLWGVVYMSHSFLPLMQDRGEAALVNVSSLFGLIGSEDQSSYCATKFAVRGFTEALQREYRKTGINVICVHPGGIKTNIARNARMYLKGKLVTDTEKLVRRFDKLARTTAADAAKTIITGMKKKKQRIIIGPDAKLMDRLQRLMPAGYRRMMDILFGTK